MLIDSHCHLNEIVDDVMSIIERAKNNAVDVMLNVCTEMDMADEVISTTKFDGIYASVGQHPVSAKNNSKLVDDMVTMVQANKKIIALGETGLDYYKGEENRAPKDIQVQSFEAHIEVAKITGLPLIIHNRDADDDIYEILKKTVGKVKFIMHCFGSDVACAKKFLDLGGYISFSGIVTFKNAIKTHEACRVVPLDRLLIETDAPYLAPTPHRGKKNEPSYLPLVAEHIATLHGTTTQIIAQATTSNFAKLTGLDLTLSQTS